MNNSKIHTDVVCVLKTNDVYKRTYVEKLYDACMKHSHGKVNDFICFSDDESVSEFCTHEPLLYSMPGWWSKLEIFDLEPSGNYLYFDLDTIINGDITPLLEYDYKSFTSLNDFYNIYRNPNKGEKSLASGVLGWSGDFSYLLDEYANTNIDNYTMAKGKNGDQAFIADHIKGDVEYFQDIFPGMFSSKKWAPLFERERSSVVCYHGKPRPHECDWII